MKKIDLNCDLGEGFGPYSFGQDELLLPYISSANIACGFHAGDPHSMRDMVAKCLAADVAIGAHPGFPDRLGFGRRAIQVTAREIYDYLLYQIGALNAFVQAAGGELSHVKPHGALYHMAGNQPELAEAVIQALLNLNPRLILFAQSGSLLLELASAAGLPVAAEAFADRTYQQDGSLTPRTSSDALIGDAQFALEQALSIVCEERVFTPEGAGVPIHADTICLHGDGIHAASFAAMLNEGLRSSGVSVAAPGRNA
ncbi:LamB/YcsF family protein [Paenibacillus sp. GCM10012307]|uniref:5-oxoprolinase subunit A n=1 Tax=Paenibacillus roseus TaxID=2798579 RepID=A0A934MSG4_9BACL|nr:5-oxoprolinase subunit PxpA [Paenibacillus roseus]MBJ6363908.1 5-oxoprolinase subunit PxpA [Paenibacillus roseus]